MLRGGHPGQGAPLPLPCLAAHPVGHHPHNIPSRFLAEVPAELIHDVGVVGSGGLPAGLPRAPARRQTTGAETLGLVPGDLVVHDRWGEGTVVSAKGEGDGAQAEVRFASVGTKKLLLSAAPLRRA